MKKSALLFIISIVILISIWFIGEKYAQNRANEKVFALNRMLMQASDAAMANKDNNAERFMESLEPMLKYVDDKDVYDVIKRQAERFKTLKRERVREVK